jgi:peptidyl-tRNA hydrolase
MAVWFYPGQEDYITKLNELGAIAELTTGANGWTPVFAAVQDAGNTQIKEIFKRSQLKEN